MADVEAIRGEAPHTILQRLGYTQYGSLAQTLTRHGRKDLAREFWRLDRAARRQAGKLRQ